MPRVITLCNMAAYQPVRLVVKTRFLSTDDNHIKQVTPLAAEETHQDLVPAVGGEREGED